MGSCLILGLAVIWVGCYFRICCDFGDLRNLWRFLGLLRGGKYFSSWSRSFILDTHTTSSWTWARRASEPVEVFAARNYFLVGWEVNPVGSIKRSVQQEQQLKDSSTSHRYRYFSIDYSGKFIKIKCSPQVIRIKM